MKTFEDLKFERHLADPGGLAARMFFKNGYGVSVIRFYGSHTAGDEWELAVLKGDAVTYTLTYDTHITDDVLGHLTAEMVSEVMKRVQKLPAVKGGAK